MSNQNSVQLPESTLAEVCATPVSDAERSLYRDLNFIIDSHEFLSRLKDAGFLEGIGTFKQTDIKKQSRFAWSFDPNVVKTACVRAFIKTRRRVVKISANQVIEAVKSFDDYGVSQPNFANVIYYVVVDKKPTMTPEGFVSMFDQFLDRAKAQDGIVYVQASVPCQYVTNHLTQLEVSPRIF